MTQLPPEVRAITRHTDPAKARRLLEMLLQGASDTASWNRYSAALAALDRYVIAEAQLHPQTVATGYGS